MAAAVAATSTHAHAVAATSEAAVLLVLQMLQMLKLRLIARWAALLTTAAAMATGTDTSAARPTIPSLTAAVWEAGVLLMVRMLQPLELTLRTHLAAPLMATAAMARGPDTPAARPTTHPTTAEALEAAALLIYAVETADRSLGCAADGGSGNGGRCRWRRHGRR